MNIFEKGKVLPVGSIRMHGGIKKIKTAEGWIPYKEEHKDKIEREQWVEGILKNIRYAYKNASKPAIALALQKINSVESKKHINYHTQRAAQYLYSYQRSGRKTDLEGAAADLNHYKNQAYKDLNRTQGAVQQHKAENVDKRVQDIVNSDRTKSSKIRELHSLGISKPAIAQHVGAHYSQVHQVTKNFKPVAEKVDLPGDNGEGTTELSRDKEAVSENQVRFLTDLENQDGKQVFGGGKTSGVPGVQTAAFESAKTVEDLPHWLQDLVSRGKVQTAMSMGHVVVAPADYQDSMLFKGSEGAALSDFKKEIEEKLKDTKSSDSEELYKLTQDVVDKYSNDPRIKDVENLHNAFDEIVDKHIKENKPKGGDRSLIEQLGTLNKKYPNQPNHPEKLEIYRKMTAAIPKG